MAIKQKERKPLHLAKLHVHKGDRILLYAENQPEWGAAYLAAVSLGAVVVPADRQLRECDVLGMARRRRAARGSRR